ncbi:hypothetical protein VST7929_02585 [Vibrio stylophorae]|uniref:Uncharacterized protein n=1 Tax=Vibrio stylophorae TaxID=659351 RepID=A0ABN8DV05_9VIBR|nr:hypothetical protein [Vibrio stylophorae]CAH0534635.1 hypothetical protein VST7929_02585 [Vibrio stylophorae]
MKKDYESLIIRGTMLTIAIAFLIYLGLNLWEIAYHDDTLSNREWGYSSYAENGISLWQWLEMLQATLLFSMLSVLAIKPSSIQHHQVFLAISIGLIISISITTYNTYEFLINITKMNPREQRWIANAFINSTCIDFLIYALIIYRGQLFKQHQRFFGKKVATPVDA